MGTRTAISILMAASMSMSLLSFAPNGSGKSQSRDQSVSKADEAVAFDINAIRKPVVGRVEIGADRLQSATVYVPPGTRAYLAGRLDDDRADLLAWYNVRTNLLVAAVEILVADDADATKDGIEINAAPNGGGKASALVTIKSRRSSPALLRPEGAVTLQASDDSQRYELAPLLSFEGSSHLVSLTHPLSNDFLQSKRFDVRVHSAKGDAVFSQRELPARGDIPVKVQIGTTTPNKPRRVDVYNPGSLDKIVSLKPEAANVKWSDTMGTETRTIEVPAGATVSPGSLVSRIPGSFPLSYAERSIAAPDRGVRRAGDWAEGPVVVDESGAATVVGLSDCPVTGATTDHPNTVPTVLPGPSNSTNHPTLPNRPNGSTGSSASAGSRSSNGASRFAVALGGLVGAGAMSVLLNNERGEKHEEQVSFVPVSSDGLEEHPSIVEITPISTTGLLTEIFAFHQDPQESGQSEGDKPGQTQEEPKKPEDPAKPDEPKAPTNKCVATLEIGDLIATPTGWEKVDDKGKVVAKGDGYAYSFKLKKADCKGPCDIPTIEGVKSFNCEKLAINWKWELKGVNPEGGATAVQGSEGNEEFVVNINRKGPVSYTVVATATLLCGERVLQSVKGVNQRVDHVCAQDAKTKEDGRKISWFGPVRGGRVKTTIKEPKKEDDAKDKPKK